MSEKVQVLAASIYKEFELMIQKVGEDNVKVGGGEFKRVSEK